MIGRTPPPAHVLEAFSAGGEVQRLAGGQGTSWLSGRVVLKPGDETFQRWLGQMLAGRVFDGIQVPRPLQARSGEWVADGWSATEFVEGDVPDLAAPSTWTHVIAAGRRFHDALVDVPAPTFHAARTDPWAVADRVAWGEDSVTFVPRLADLADRLLAVDDPPGATQLVHLDLTGNVLFSPRHPPAVIDVSPYWRPRSYADGVVLADAACYHGATRAHLLEADVPVEAIARALLFRLTTTNVLVTKGFDGVDLDDEARRFERAARLLGV